MLPQAFFNFIFWISLISFIGVVVATIYFIVRYHRSRWDPFKTPYITGHSMMEISVSVGLFILVMIIFAWGWIDYKKIINAPSDPLEISVLGKQWMWEFEYANGRKLTNELVVPQGRPVKLIMSSADVLHSFYIPNFRLKQDVVPGTYTTLWFEATQVGEHPVFCAEYCGTAHSKMLATVKVLKPEEYDRWEKEEKKEEGASVSPVELGKNIFTQKGCNVCHTLTTQTLVGPGLLGIFGKEVELADGKKAQRDENYIRESLMQPQAKLVKGFPPVMPTFQGTLTDEEVNAIVAYFKNLK
ncbi:MAG: cytochrome c oxidase subunit II [Deltaproteobacteria bacterium]|nr:cytochrome c oxidase subunit II [Deltaproteobacteria bacterium]